MHPAPNQTACPSCTQPVSPRAFDCPHCGHPLRKPRRGFFGWLIKWTFILFNLAMLAWLVSYSVQIATLTEGLTSEAEQAGAAIGAGIGMTMLASIWAGGTVILGLLVLLTRPRK